MVEKYFYELDLKLFDWCQSAAKKIQKWVGITSIEIARMLFHLYFLLYLLYIYLEFRSYHSAFNVVTNIVGFGVIFVFCSTMFSLKLRSLRDENLQLRLKVVIGSLRRIFLVWYHCGIISWILFYPDAQMIAKHPFIIKIHAVDFSQENIKLLFFFFLDCTPPPPKKSDVKKLIEKIVEAVTPTPDFAIIEGSV
jgi:hypothetical protein